MKTFLSISAISGFLSVALGAFGAHALKPRWEQFPRFHETYQTAVQYQMYHTLALLAVALLIRFFPENRMFGTAGWLFTAGIIIFSGSLYTLSMTGITKLGAITPFGGLCFLAGWAVLLWQAMKI